MLIFICSFKDVSLLKSPKRKLKSRRTSSQKSLDSDVFPLSKSNSSEGNDSSVDDRYFRHLIERMANFSNLNFKFIVDPAVSDLGGSTWWKADWGLGTEVQSPLLTEMMVPLAKILSIVTPTQ